MHFHAHLSDTMTSRISELDSTVFCGAEETGDDGSAVSSTLRFHSQANPGYVLVTYDVFQGDSEELGRCLFSLRLLAKFLGFLHFLPYHSPHLLPSAMLTQQIDIRNRVRNHTNPIPPCTSVFCSPC